MNDSVRPTATGPAPGNGRRTFCRNLLATLTGASLLDLLVSRKLLADTVRPLTDRWVRRLQEECADLRSSTLDAVTWQRRIEELLEQVELVDLLRAIDFDRLERGIELPDRGVATKPARLPRVDGLPDRLAYFSKVFGVGRGRAIIPHAHRNMVSAHLILRGEFHLRHYDRVEDQGEHLVIRPTIDTIAGPGEASSISDDRDNVHWFVAQSDAAFTFDVLVLDLEGEKWTVENLDPRAGEKLADGSLRVPKLGVEEALARYGAESHHVPGEERSRG